MKVEWRSSFQLRARWASLPGRRKQVRDMFMLQLLKIIFFVSMLFIAFRLVMRLLGGGTAGERRARGEGRPRDIPDSQQKEGKKKGVIELDKDQYKVE
jgi:hypothetical protein